MKYKLKDIFDLQMGKTPPRNNQDYWNTNDNKWISIADLSKTGKYISKTKEHLSDDAVKDSGIKVIPANTVVMSFKLSIGKTAITAEDMYSNEAIMAFHDRHVVEILPEYIFYMFKYKNWDESSNKAVMGKTLNKATLSEVVVEICPIEKQREIVAILDKMMDVLSGREQELQNLDDLIKARFVEMFGLLGMDKFNWGWTTLGKVCKVNPSKSQDARLSNGVEVSFVPMSAVNESGEIDTSTVKKYDEVKTGFTYFTENDVLFAKITPCMENGKGAVAKGLLNGIGFGSTEFHVLRPNSDMINPYWLYTLTTFPQFRIEAANNMTGSAGQRRVPASFLENYRIAVPPIEKQEQFADFVKATDKSKVAIQKALDTTQLLFDSLMQKYFG